MNFKNDPKPIPGTKRIEFRCVECGKHKEAYKSNAGPKLYCSTKCSAVSRGRIMKDKSAQAKSVQILDKNNDAWRACLYCDQAFMVLSNNKKKIYCSVKCANLHHNTKKTKAEADASFIPRKSIPVDKYKLLTADQLTNAECITEKNTELTTTVKKSDVYKFKCIKCGTLVARYLSRGKPVPRFCSKKCTRWLGDTDRKPADTSSHHIHPAKTYAETERGFIGKYLPNTRTFGNLLILVIQISVIMYLIYSPKLRAADIEIPERICRSPKIQSIKNYHLYDKAAAIMDTTYEVIEKVSFLKVENHGHIETVALCYNAKEFERSRTILASEILRLTQRTFDLTIYIDRE